MITAAGTALATPIIVNGNFSSSSYAGNNQFGTGYGGQGVTGWTGNKGYELWFVSGTATTIGAATQYNSGGRGTGSEKLWGTSSFTGSSPTGDNFVALDGDVTIGNAGGAAVSQAINGLTIGTNYAITFTWAAGQLQSRTGPTTDYLAVSLGNQVFNTPTAHNASKGFSGWSTVTYVFSATSASEVLKFLSIGTPTGGPPIALLTDISIADVPEPGSLAVFGAGLLGIAALRRKRRA